MYFPTTGLLDTFNRANEGPPPSASWGVSADPDDTAGLAVVSNQGKVGGAGYGAATWNSSFAANQEAYCTVPAGQGAAECYLQTRLLSPGTAGWDAYVLLWFGTTFNVYAVVDNVYGATIASFTVADINGGGKCGLSVVGSLITTYIDSGGGWAEAGNVSHGGLQGGGQIGVSGTPNLIIDDFGGGAVVAGSFPTTGLLDSFTGSDEAPIATNWSSIIRFGDAGADRVANQLEKPATGGYSSYYDLSTFGPDSEVWATITEKPAEGAGFVSVYLRIVDPGAAGPSEDAYGLVLWPEAATDRLQFWKNLNGTETQLGSDVLLDFAAGDGIGLRAVADELTAWRRSSGVWTLAGIRTDSGVTAAGYIGARFHKPTNTLGKLDDFGGGTFATVTATSLPRRGMALAS